ncbi:unnamed protein product [Caenorhabditis angaria]|uniref:Uncharacterized protein n=1 Tax=Caenorhabditis angaria TaxID=860376 RepID=A0A9P1N7Y9_9PELO|nr:unnamed protein product [Caenorhabditis angaria]
MKTLKIFVFIHLIVLVSAYGSGSEESQIDEIINDHTITHFLVQKAIHLSENSKEVDELEEMEALDRASPEYSKNQFIIKIMDEADDYPLEEQIENFENVLFYAFKSFGCDREEIWPNYYQLTETNLHCIAYSLMEQVYTQSEFTRKYFARAIHFGLNSNTPIGHRINEMAVYQFLLPDMDRVWFGSLKAIIKNSLWNEIETWREEHYETTSFKCGSIAFIQTLQDDIDKYVNGK